MKKNQISFVIVIIFPITVLFMISVIVISMMFQIITVKNIRRNLIETNNNISENISDKINDLIDNFEKVLLIYKYDDYKFSDIKKLVLANYDYIEKIYILDFNGKVVYSSYENTEQNYDMKNKPYFKTPRETGKIYISESFISSISYQPTITISIPFEDRIIVGFLNLQNFSQTINKKIKNSDDNITIIDHHGYIISNIDIKTVYNRTNINQLPEVKKAIQDNISIMEFKRDKDNPKILTFSSINKCRWTVIISRDKKYFYRQITLFNRIILVYILLILVISTFLSIIFYRYFKKQFSYLILTTKEISDGNYDLNFKYNGFKELDYLANNFSKMIVAINNRDKDIKKSLNEKVVLIKEIHHRVKNNLQIIVSLLGLELSTIKDQKLQNILIDIKNRIKSMSLIHEKLYSTENFSIINFSEYIRGFVNEIHRSFNFEFKTININFFLKDVTLSLNQAIPCGLILNEILTNAFKHAFPQDIIARPQINIYLDNKDEKVFLTIEDNGVGIQNKIDLATTTSLGLNIINTLVLQLSGEYSLSKESGTKWSISFPKS